MCVTCQKHTTLSQQLTNTAQQSTKSSKKAGAPPRRGACGRLVPTPIFCTSAIKTQYRRRPPACLCCRVPLRRNELPPRRCNGCCRRCALLAHACDAAMRGCWCGVLREGIAAGSAGVVSRACSALCIQPEKATVRRVLESAIMQHPERMATTEGAWQLQQASTFMTNSSNLFP